MTAEGGIGADFAFCYAGNGAEGFVLRTLIGFLAKGLVVGRSFLFSGVHLMLRREEEDRLKEVVRYLMKYTAVACLEAARSERVRLLE